MSLRLHDRQNTTPEAGFAIIDALIASAVFALALLALVLALIGFFNKYYKALAKTTTQNNVQSISDTVEQAIKLVSSGASITYTAPPVNGSALGALCIGNTEFAFSTGWEQPTETTANVGVPGALYELPKPSSCTTNPQADPNWSLRTSLLGDHYRLITFSVVQVAGTASWAVDIKLAYTSGGSNGAGLDLMCSPSIPNSSQGGCSPTAANIAYSDLTTKNDIDCKTSAGSQFCDIAELQSIVGTHIQ